MPETNLRQKFLLLFLGIVITLALMEALLRLGGGVFAMLQENRNRAQPQDGQEYRILCIGESTTAIGGEDSYPFQLQAILNEGDSPFRFKVINKGLVSKTTQDILDELEVNLSKYKPQLVVAMMGINDADPLIGIKEKKPSFADVLDHSRVVKFFKLLRKHLTTPRAVPAPTPPMVIPQESPSEPWIPNVENGEFDNVAVMERMYQGELEKMQTIDHRIKGFAESAVKASSFAFYLGNYHRLKKNFPKAKEYLDISLKLNPHYISPYIELGIYYREQKDYKNAIAQLRKAIEIKDASVPAHLELGRCLSEMGLVQEAYKFYKIIAVSKPRDYWVYHEVGRWFVEHGFVADAQAVYEKALHENADDLTALHELVKVTEAQGDEEGAARYRSLEEKLSRQFQSYLPATLDNYHRIIDAVLSRQVQFIAMQYPLRSIDPLKEALARYKTIAFAENLGNFTAALKTGSYSDYFIDRFAGNFGHCTGKGNRLIAQNLADVIKAQILTVK